MQVYVGGSTAIAEDFAGVIRRELPLFIGVIVGLGCLLLLIAFRSLLVPLAAAVMNLLAAGATFGVLVMVFQWGWGVDLLDIGTGPVEAFLPLFMLAILFGLSMDYQVFLVSRMREEWVHTGDNRRSVIAGQTDTSRVITAAATIMIFVFGAFVLAGQRVLAEVGLGLAAAILIDAFVLRTLLVPSVMHLIGPANWWIPRWLDRALPHLSIDPPEAPRETNRDDRLAATRQ
jgi:RND superfamily putative drug exporter